MAKGTKRRASEDSDEEAVRQPPKAKRTGRGKKAATPDSDADSDAAPPPAKKPRKGPKGTKGADTSSKDKPLKKDDSAPEIFMPEVTFSPELMQTVLATISDEEKYCNALYPPMSGNQQLSSAQGGGLPKIDAHCAVAMDVFRHLPEFASYIAEIEANPTSKPHVAAKKKWGIKIKNITQKMQKVVTEWIKAQGETGAGLTDAQRSDGFRNALEIQETNYPWFSAMRELVEKRPNCIAVGLGHSRSDVDLSVFTDVLDEPVDGPEGEPGMDAERARSEDATSGEAMSVDNTMSTSARSGAARPLSQPQQLTSAERGSSGRATAPTTKKAKAESRFTDALKEEAVTKQHQIALQQERVRAMADLEAKKMDGDLEIKKLRLIQKHELKLAKEKRRALKYGFASPDLGAPRTPRREPATHTPLTGSRDGMSDHIHSAPTTPEFTTDNDVVMDEPSSSRSSIPAWLTTSPSTPALSNDGSPSTATNYSTPSASNAFDDGLYTHDSIMTGGVDSGLSLPASFDFNPFGDKNMPSETLPDWASQLPPILGDAEMAALLNEFQPGDFNAFIPADSYANPSHGMHA